MKLFSLRFRLILFISAVLLIACTITTAISYFELKNSLKSVLDSQQLLFAKRLASFNAYGRIAPIYQPSANINLEIEEIKELNYDDVLSFAIFNRQGKMILNDGGEGKDFTFYGGFFPSKESPAIVTDSDKWRVLWLLSNDGRSIVAVGQKQDYQDEVLAGLMVKQLLPWFVTFAIVIGCIVIVIHRGFLPMKQLAREIALRKPDDDSLINVQSAPKELFPFVVALNELLTKITLMLSKERQFISDAAHELRTPLAALRVQAEVAQISADDVDAQKRALDNLLLGVERMSHLVAQLLTLSRLDTIDMSEYLERVSWRIIIEDVINELSPFIEQKNMTILVNEAEPQIWIKGHRLLLTILVRNIISNAIRYTPASSEIIISIGENSIIFSDNGPGIEDEFLSRLGERFYRPKKQQEKGSGLGLSIVKKIAQLHHIETSFCNRMAGGFVVTLIFSQTLIKFQEKNDKQIDKPIK